ncbi:hypothetical protein CH300_28070, partial [Rhodococcus sp. 15-1154-1]
GATLDSLVCSQVRRSPDAVAVVDDAGTELTYRVFGERVDAMARVLLEQGVRRGDRVAVALPRSIDLVVALHAIVRAGAAYVPIDPEYPSERVGHILADADPAVIVTDTATGHAHQGVFTTPVLVLDDPDTRTPPTHSGVGAVVPSPPTPGDIAYVIFTSGTTGRPKGVQVNHAAIVNRLTWMAQDHRITASDRILQKTPAVFDVSVWELFLPFTLGASLVIARDSGHKDPTYLADIIERRDVTVAHFVPAMLAAFLTSTPDPTRLTSLRRVFFSGEALPTDTATAADTLFTGAELHNLYGPTEAAVDITTHPVTETARPQPLTVPIGTPVAGSYVRVLDTWLRETAPGVTGELYLGGIQLADNYITRPDLTTTRFVADPSATTGERLYRTGDLVRWNTTGTLDYLGRSDDQVKIRGFRIELDDIRTTLETHPTITAAVVVALDHPTGGKYLAAYYTPGTDTGPGTPDTLRAHLTDRLPDYMVPTTYTELDTFPTTPNGKLDRTALPTPTPDTRTTGRPPHTPTEHTLTHIYRDTLHLDPTTTLTTDDDFFALGGD